nr:hypothetical protein TetV2_00542 [Oceanusvirus sp.]
MSRETISPRFVDAAAASAMAHRNPLLVDSIVASAMVERMASNTGHPISACWGLYVRQVLHSRPKQFQDLVDSVPEALVLDYAIRTSTRDPVACLIDDFGIPVEKVWGVVTGRMRGGDRARLRARIVAHVRNNFETSDESYRSLIWLPATFVAEKPTKTEPVRSPPVPLTRAERKESKREAKQDKRDRKSRDRSASVRSHQRQTSKFARFID